MDEPSFHNLYLRTAPRLRTYVARVVGNIAVADDIVQETYLRLLRAAPPSEDPERLNAFLFRVASNLIADHWRRRRRESHPRDESLPAPAAADPDASLRVDMARLFVQLQPRQRQLLWLAYVEGADHREIAAALGVGERSVRVLLYRARRKLARLLEQRGQDSGEP